MSTGLYEELGINPDASAEDIRKAYRKKALQTHPDRLRGATDAQKAISEEKFRKVNNAYEVLNDSEKRREYDRYKVWPPPEEPQWSPSAQANGSNHGRWPPRSNTFPDPFMSHPTGFPGFHFSDPFSLFEQFFAGTPFSRSSRHRHPFFTQPDPFGHVDIDDLLDELDRDHFGMRGFPSFSPFPSFPAFPPVVFSSSSNGGTGTRWVSESFSSSMINGVTQSIHKRTDSEGNEHVTRTLPDGRQIRTINGVEQSVQQRIAHSEPNQRRPSTTRYLPQPFPPPQLIQNDPRNYVTSELPPPYPTSSQSQSYHSRQNDGHDYPHHHHRNRNRHRRPTEQWPQP